MVYKFSLAILGLLFSTSNAIAQLIPDTTLGNENSTISIDELRQLIEGGAIRGDNLFHSFQEFNIGEGEGVYFANPDGIQNIFTRITGGNPSQILGTLGVNGTADLFLINPNGIIFGQSAKLDLQGSFTVTTADSILFPNDLEFSAVDPKSPPVLTIDRPLGLVLNNRSSEIKIQNIGHDIDTDTIFSLENYSIAGLSLPYGKTFNIIANNINLDSGIISVPNGNINVTAISQGTIKLNFEDDNISFDLDGNLDLGNISLANSALIEITQNNNGAINLFAKNLNLDNNSIIINKNTEPTANIDSINIKVTETLNINQISSTIGKSSLILVENLGSQAGSDLTIDAESVKIKDNGLILSRVFGTGDGGDININSKNVELLSLETIPSFLKYPIVNLTEIVTRTSSSGTAGNININTERFSIIGGGVLGSFTFARFLGAGDSGNINLTAKDIFLDSTNPVSIVMSAIGTSSLGSLGNSGNTYIKTERLTIQNGSVISTPSGNLGNSGSIFIEASDFVKVFGESSIPNNPSTINSSIDRLNPAFFNFINVDNLIQGQSGSITITTDRLIIDDRGVITVRNEGLGSSGNIEINANFLTIDNGSITATTQSGEGGSIILNSQDIRLNNAIVATDSDLIGNGGQVSIETNSLLTLNNSIISANAIQGDGGKISILTNGLFASPDTQITATSAFGKQGEVTIEVLNDSIGRTLEISNFQIDRENQIIADSCFTNRERNRNDFKIIRSDVPTNSGDSVNNFIPDSTATSSEIIVGEELVTTEDGELFLVAKTKPEPVENLVCQ